MTQYGDIFEIWFDGANGGDGYYGGTRGTRKIDRTTYYDWSNTYKLIRELQPKIVIWNDGGDRADLRWVGQKKDMLVRKIGVYSMPKVMCLRICYVMV
jgi:alpha-L-fucosidase